MNRLQGKTALVTGAARGIGAAIAKAFVDEGAFVILTDINDELGKATAGLMGANALYRKLDVRLESDWESTVSDIDNSGRLLHILVNNAGITGFDDMYEAHDPENASLQSWRKVHETNLDGVFLGCKYGIKAMRKSRGGSIINISSRSGVVGIAGAAAYASSKAAVRNHTKTVALYGAEKKLNIRCNSIHPASILTPMWEPILGAGMEREKRMLEFVKDTPLKRFGTCEEVAAVAVMLASDESAYITGSEFHIDGGMLAGTFTISDSDK